jgi:predicted transcriptional regulator
MTRHVEELAVLITLLSTAHRAGNRDLWRAVKAELERKYGVEIRFLPKRQGAPLREEKDPR